MFPTRQVRNRDYVWSLPVSAAEDIGLLRVGALRAPAKRARHRLVEHLGLFVLGTGRGRIAGTEKWC